MAGKAVFLDRDGVLNRLVLNPATGAFESPHRVADLALTPDLGALLGPLQKAGFSLFVVSNQPSCAKGKASMEALLAIQAALDEGLKAQGLRFADYLYCFHHPDSVVPELKGPCDCRKPSPFLVRQALAVHGLDPAASFLVGDQDTDIECGRGASLRSVLIETPESASKRGASRPDAVRADLAGAVRWILAQA